MFSFIAEEVFKLPSCRYLKSKLLLSLTALLWIAFPCLIFSEDNSLKTKDLKVSETVVADSDSSRLSWPKADSTGISGKLLIKTEVKESTWAKLKELFR